MSLWHGAELSTRTAFYLERRKYHQYENACPRNVLSFQHQIHKHTNYANSGPENLCYDVI